jgi:ATP phosphoribosyltransferase
MSLKTPLRFGLPKGSLEQSTFELLARAGFKVQVSSRGYKPYINDTELDARLVRPQEMSRYVAQGFLDFGITGKDWVQESGHEVEVLCDLAYSKATSLPARWVVAVPEDSPMKSVRDLQGKRIAAHNVSAEIEFSWGATEVKVPELVDAIVDLTETGSSLRANKLRILDTIIESYPQLIVNKAVLADPEKRRKLEGMKLLLIGALNAREKVGLKMNVPKSVLEKLSSTLPALRNPTVSPLADSNWTAVEIIIDESVVRDLIPRLKELGAEGIIEYPLNKVVY